MDARLLVDGVKDSGFGTFVGQERSGEIKLEAFGNLVLEFDLGAEDVAGSPSLGYGETMLAVGPFGLNLSIDGLGLGITAATSLERHAGRGVGLYFKAGSLEVIVLAEEVVGRLSKVLETQA